jgi:hypothetical protein
LPAATLIEHFLIQVLPSNIKGIRHYGRLARAKASSLLRVRQALSVPPFDSLATIEDFM